MSPRAVVGAEPLARGGTMRAIVKLEVDIPIPEGELDESAKDRLRRDALEAAVLRLFDERRISSAEAAAELGLTRVRFMELASKHGIPQHDYTAEDLSADLADLEGIERWFQER